MQMLETPRVGYWIFDSWIWNAIYDAIANDECTI